MPTLTDSAPTVPELVAGDRLTRQEFERRYRAMTRVKKAELVEGVVYMPSPVSQQRHGAPHARIVGWLVYYAARTPGVEPGDNATVRLDLDNELQPDALLRIEPRCRGATRDVEGYLEGPPELVVEVAASSASYDLHDKLRAYRRNGVREYLVWRVDDREVDWFVLREGEYVRQAPAADGLLCSEVFAGLWLSREALLSGDVAAVFAATDRGCATAGHAAFVAGLQGRR